MKELISDHQVTLVKKMFSSEPDVEVLEITENGKRRILIKEKKK